MRQQVSWGRALRWQVQSEAERDAEQFPPLSSRIGVYGTATSGVRKLKQTESLSAANFAHNDSVGPVPESSFQKNPNGFLRLST